MSTSLSRSRHSLAYAFDGAAGLGLVRGLLARAARALETRRDLRLLSAAGDDMLRDIGLSRGGIESAVRYGRSSAGARPLGRATGPAIPTLPSSWTEWR
jgi:uncharacterized protein YjiS (DUF1127 family)